MKNTKEYLRAYDGPGIYRIYFLASDPNSLGRAVIEIAESKDAAARQAQDKKENFGYLLSHSEFVSMQGPND